MIETKEQYEAQMNVIEVHLGTPGVDARETIEALREVAKAAERVWATVPSVRGPDDHPEVQKHAVALNDLKLALNNLSDWITEDG